MKNAETAMTPAEVNRAANRTLTAMRAFWRKVYEMYWSEFLEPERVAEEVDRRLAEMQQQADGGELSDSDYPGGPLHQFDFIVAMRSMMQTWR